MKILGFDVSSSTIGYCVLDIDEAKNITFVKAAYLKPIKKGSIIERLADTREKVKSIIEQIKPDEIAIEDIIQFMAGGSTAKTIITLTSFNRMIGLLSYDYLQRSPKMFSVMSIRHGLKKAVAEKSLPKKEQLPFILETLLNINFPWELNNKGKIKIESYDKSDAMCCAYFCVLKLIND